MKIKPLRVLIIVTIFISVISLGCGIYIYSDMKERKEASLDVIRVRNSLNEKEEALTKSFITIINTFAIVVNFTFSSLFIIIPLSISTVNII